MKAQQNKTSTDKSPLVERTVYHLPVGSVGSFQFQDNRPEVAIQRKIQQMANDYASNSIIQPKANNTGLPNQLKSGIENLSGFSMDDVKVHYNSPKPAQLQAHAYAQGTDIHIAAGQEKHLPHEAWHVVQQKQGRVRPTMQMKGKININDDSGLEKEADVMGGKAMQIQQERNVVQRIGKTFTKIQHIEKNKVVQRVLNFEVGKEDNLARVQALFKAAYRVNLGHGHASTHSAGLVFTRSAKRAPYGSYSYTITEQNRDIPHEGIGAHLIGKIIDEGDVKLYFGENRNEANPVNHVESSRGEPSPGQILLSPGCSAIELIHELIHTYHFAFDPWNAAQKNEEVNINGEIVSAEEASTTGLGQWSYFPLTENAFRGHMGLPHRDRY